MKYIKNILIWVGRISTVFFYTVGLLSVCTWLENFAAGIVVALIILFGIWNLSSVIEKEMGK